MSGGTDFWSVPAAGACHLFYTKERSSEHFGKTGVPTSNIERFKRWFGQTDAYTHTAKNTELWQNILLNYRRGQETEDEMWSTLHRRTVWKNDLLCGKKKKPHRRSRNQDCIFMYQTQFHKITFAVASYQPHSTESHKAKHCTQMHCTC